MPAADRSRADKPFWLARSMRTIFFFVLALTLAGTYAAFHVPISVFPETNFPRGVDNGVMPVGQMEVTITRPIENAVNSVPRARHRAVEDQSRFCRNQSLLQLVCRHVPNAANRSTRALSKVQQELPASVKITTNRLTFATFPVLGYSLTSNTVSQTRLWEIATYDLKPPPQSR